MKRSVDGRMLWWKLLVVLLVFWTGTAVAWEGTVHRVQDGDSFQVKRGQATVTVRLYGIDCPEYGQPFGEEAKRAASGMMQGKKVVIEPMDTDQYGRIVAVVLVRGMVVNTELVRRGLAWVYPKFCTSQPFCHRLEEMEQAARAAGVGLWRDRRPVPPWVWKRGRR